MMSREMLDAIGRSGCGAVVRVVVIGADGSCPREVGAAMIIGTDSSEGTIGGGALELAVTAHARAMLAEGTDLFRRDTKAYPLGPALGQCCGGLVEVLFERIPAGDLAALWAGEPHGVVVHPLGDSRAPWLVTSRKPQSDLPVPVAGIVSAMLAGKTAPHPRIVRSGDASNGYFIEAVRGVHTPVYLYGAGHVGREIVRIIDGLAIDLVWIDTSRDRFPALVRDGVRVVVAEHPDQIACDAPGEALHLVMTYSHALDEAICRAVLAGAAFQFLGLIGSQTKRARFVQRMRRAGIAEATLSRLTCPIGVGGITSKSPVAIAIAAAAQIARECEWAARPKQAERTHADDV